MGFESVRSDESLFSLLWRPQPVAEPHLPAAPIRRVEVKEAADATQILAILNRSKCEPPQASKLSDALDDAALKRKTVAEELFKALVDEWINTGYSQSGDFPTKRNFARAEGASGAIHEASKSGLLSLIENEGGTGLQLTIESSEEPAGQFGSFWAPDAPRDFANQQLTRILLSDLRFRLAKCRRQQCGVYFLLSQWNRAYRHGTRCSTCIALQRTDQAVALTRISRENATQKLHELAAAKFYSRILANENWHNCKRFKVQIAGYLSERIRRDAENGKLSDISKVYPKGITGKWVARSDNWSAIQSLARKVVANK